MEFRDLKTQYQNWKPEIDAAIAGVLQDGQYIMGKQVGELERQLAEYVGARHCIACANGTDALQLALMAWGIGNGDIVFVSDFSFFASAEVIALVGAKPVFVDIEPDTFNMDAEALEQAICETKKRGDGTLKAVIAVDLFGQSADYIKIKPICEKHGLLLLEDAAQGFGGSINGKMNGSFGDISTTSFFPSKPLGCYGDGGAIFTDDADIAEILQSLRIHGKSKTDRYDNIHIGTNSRLDSIQAAILQVKLKVFEQYELEQVNRVAQWYAQRLADLVQTPAIKEGCRSSWAQYTIRLKTREMRDGLHQYLADLGIPTMIFYPKPLHQQKAFEHMPNIVCKAAELAGATVLSLPMHPYLQEEMVEQVAGAIRQYLTTQQ